jgi:hypothetical protein
METLRGRHCSLQQQAPFTMLSMLLVLLPPNTSGFLRRATVLLYSLERGYLAQSWCSSPMKTLRGRHYSLKQQTQFKLQNKVLTLLLQILLILSHKLHSIFDSVVWGHCEQRWCFSLLKRLRGRQYSLIQETQFTMKSKLLDPLPSKMKDFLRRTTVTWKGLLGPNLMFLTQENAER